MGGRPIVGRLAMAPITAPDTERKTMLTKKDLAEIAEITDELETGDLAATRKAEEALAELCRRAGLPDCPITTEDRLRGAITCALLEIEGGRHGAAWATLREALKL